MSAFWVQLGLVMAGGALGAAGRFLLGGWVLRQAGSSLPWGTLSVNLLGSLLAGLLWVWLQGRSDAAIWRAFLMVGLLGGFTTYSALMLELLLLQRGSGYSAALTYLMLSLLGGGALLLLGVRIAEAVRG